MATCRVQVSIPYNSGIPEDVVSNTFHFDSLAGEPINEARCTILSTHIAAFYSSVYTPTSVKCMADYLNPAATRMKFYDLSDPKPRTPVADLATPLSVGALQATRLPAEAAAVLSYHTEYVSGINKASQRGRIFLGGICDPMVDPSTPSQAPRYKTVWIAAVGDFAGDLYAAALADEWGWVVYSEKLNQSFAVAGGWMDNAIDTQRRRGVPATVRTPFVT